MNKLKIRFMMIVLTYILENSNHQKLRAQCLRLGEELQDELDKD